MQSALGLRFASSASSVALALVLVSRAALADEPRVAAEPEKEAPKESAPVEIRVIGDRDDALQKVPGSGALVTNKEIQRAAPADVSEILRRVPGVQATQMEGGGLRIDIGVRGLDATRGRRVLMLEDGVPLSANPYSEPDLYFAPSIERVRGVEVVKGSGNILFGPQTIGGVINFLTVLPPNERLAMISGDVGTYGYGRALGRYGDSFGHARYVVQALHKQGDGFHVDGFRADDAFAKLSLDTSDRGQLTLKLSVHDERASSSSAGLTRAMYASDPKRPTLARDDFAHANQVSLSATHELAFDPDTKLVTLAYAYRTSRLFVRQNYTRAPIPGTAYEHIVGTPGLDAIYFSDSSNINDRSFDVAGLETRFQKRFEAGARHTLEVGARVLYEDGSLDQRAGASRTATAGDNLESESHTSVGVAAHVEDRIAFRDNLLVTPGVRFEHATYHRAISRQPVNGVPTDVDVTGSSSENGLIPGIGMVIGAPRFNVFGGVHAGFAPPRATTAIGAANGADLLLEPERSVNYELGARTAATRAIRGELTGFLMTFSNQIVAAPAGVGQAGEINGGATRHVGLEYAVVLGIGESLGWPFGLDLSGRYTFSRATFKGGQNDGKLLPYAPLHTTSVTLDVGGRAWPMLEISWLHVSSQFSDARNTTPESVDGLVGVIPARDVVDVGLRYTEPRSHLSFSLTGKNLFDAIYIQSRRPDGIFPGGFRQLIAGARWDFPGEAAK
jgi:Fe(3+) dicitrate transport protein